MDVLISLPDGAYYAERVRSRLPQVRVRLGPVISGPGQDMPMALMRGADALYCEYPPANFDDFDALRWLQVTSAGYEHLRPFPLTEMGVRVTNGLGVFDIPIAEWNILMILAWHRRLLELLANQRETRWDRDARFQHELRGATVGLLGYGGIARETARLAKALGLRVHALTRDGRARRRENVFRVPQTGDCEGLLCDRLFAGEDMLEFLGGLDYLVLTTPLTDATRGMIGERELRALPDSAVLLNPARAPIVQEEALLRALDEGWVRGAALDAQYAYPLPATHPLWSRPNVILTPHISGHSATPTFKERSCDIFLANLERFLAGEPLLNELTPAQLAGQ